ncbi:MBOAT family O-acyltransferase [Ulvibacterium marinum]|uniref:MBOAT family protein n=1 Tax=Ulvibacterium marinum TaxID=2419782 RepID=A0A3B0CDL0_9FLAO|nr:MBOAT family protein [Ulvibacterium marinum]RKN82778.1 MBOAT family protein [Ulvibacterium marinum]
MVFSSVTFLFIFLPLVLLGYYLVSTKFRNIFLTVSSLFFYAWGEQELVMLMIFSIAVNYLGGLSIEHMEETGRKKWTRISLFFFVSINILVLGYFKYIDFFINSFNNLGLLRISSLAEIILPIGISFFTFQGMSYLIDVYYRRVKAQKNLISLALYISMFPQLIAGPIVRYIDVSKQIEAIRRFNTAQFQQGTKRFIIGLFKKVIIANQMGFIADFVFNNSHEVGLLSLWIGVVCYAFQIYFDFSGYSDMAIGLGKMFGFDFLENFDYPYISQSIQEFWRRWHISLSSWFRDYLYIPLGGNRKGVSRTYINLIIVFFITGLWHGASWNFVIWGLYHGFFLILERLFLGNFLSKAPKLVSHVYTLLVVLFGWVLFRAETLEEAMVYMKGMFITSTMGNELVFQYLNLYFVFVLVLALAFSTPIKNYFSNLVSNHISKSKQRIIVYPIVLFLFFFTILELAESNYNPFIYFRF